MIRDKLAIGVIVDDEESLHIAIKGLPKDYNAFRSAVRTRSTQLSIDELATMLNTEEESLNEGLEVKNPILEWLLLQLLGLIPTMVTINLSISLTKME